jgi:hypothetical protein
MSLAPPAADITATALPRTENRGATMSTAATANALDQTLSHDISSEELLDAALPGLTSLATVHPGGIQVGQLSAFLGFKTRALATALERGRQASHTPHGIRPAILERVKNDPVDYRRCRYILTAEGRAYAAKRASA